MLQRDFWWIVHASKSELLDWSDRSRKWRKLHMGEWWRCELDR